MMQSSTAEREYAGKETVMRRDRFLAEIEIVTPSAELATLEPFYPIGKEKPLTAIGARDAF